MVTRGTGRVGPWEGPSSVHRGWSSGEFCRIGGVSRVSGGIGGLMRYAVGLDDQGALAGSETLVDPSKHLQTPSAPQDAAELHLIPQTAPGVGFTTFHHSQELN